ncbi:MAG: YncE family protein, partial [Dermatophilaceae bacterium]
MNLERMHTSGGRRPLLVGGAALAVLAGGGVAVAASQATAPGPRPDGTALTSYGWMVTPAGRQVTLGDKPFGSTMSPDGKTVLVSNDGQYRQTLSVIDTASGNVRQSLSYDSPEALFVGLAFSPDGRHAYASAGGNNKIRTYEVTPDGKLVEGTSIPLPTTNPAGTAVNHFPAGLTVSSDDRTLWAANSLSSSVSVVDLGTRTVKIIPAGANPYAVALATDGHTAYVSNWGGASLTVIDTATGAPKGTIAVGQHPSALKVNAARGELYVADTDSDQVSVVHLASGSVSRTIDLAPYKNAPVGSSPNALALSPGGDTLYVANAGASAVDVIRLGGLHGTRDRIAGRIPTGWYPTGVEVT